MTGPRRDLRAYGAGQSAVISPLTSGLNLRPRQDSNLGSRFRKPMLYPLSYGGSDCEGAGQNLFLAVRTCLRDPSARCLTAKLTA
jgi:hypothetical protein